MADKAKKTWAEGSRESALLKVLKSDVESERRYLNEWKAKLEKDPAHAFSWGDSAFAAAGRLSIFEDVVRALEDPERDVDLEGIEKYTIERVLQRAQHPTHSTSPTSNLMYEYVTSAWAELIDKMKWI